MTDVQINSNGDQIPGEALRVSSTFRTPSIDLIRVNISQNTVAFAAVNVVVGSSVDLSIQDSTIHGNSGQNICLSQPRRHSPFECHSGGSGLYKTGGGNLVVTDCEISANDNSNPAVAIQVLVAWSM